MRSFPLLLVLAVTLSFIAAPPTQAGGLTPDGRAGLVTAVQGISLVRPVGRERWTPLDTRGLVFPGDVVRTEARGANALELRLAQGGRLILGPGTSIEFPDAGGVRVLRGELEVKGDEKAAVSVTAPGGYAKDVAGVLWLRAGEREAKELAKEPRWLEGYRASTSEEWMGSLLATVDGKNVPLAVGYHKVTVEIRDQIARTTVEESFVNSSDATLEGVFSFPLPADASISGFGMWIGDELVEADIVEKQRAREIYEDILRRKKDPGLLEWEGGNLFKARVFPIFPRSEKRIRIRYTEVLPLEGDAYRYRYALRSELLRLNPLRELKMQVNVLSSTPLKDVASPTHEVTLRKTEHEAVVEFGAQEYVPERDFEVAITVGRGEGLSAVAHRRADDGFFMLLLAPPDPEAGGWKRDLVPEGEALNLVIVADTSGSMDAASRAAQTSFVAALLAQLSEKDRFRILTTDVEARWLSDAPFQPASEAEVARALSTLEERFSLGWTDLDRAFAEVASGAGTGVQVVYVGDGIPTAGDADAVATADRIRALGKTLVAKDPRLTFHAVATSSSYEKGVLEAISSVGGGSVRRGDDAPVKSAQALLAEIARPGVRDLKVEITGLPTAKVYPEVLPNLPLGQQQVVLGRFLPGGDAKTAEVVVTGRLAGKPVRFSSSFAVPAPEEGNSFLPRLWARRHLDVLLAGGRTPAVQEEVVLFSREYQIMTPFTSFLVLENDEDRERYGVERTVKMRDAERFFADAKDKAALEIARQQMETAGRWRLDLRRRILKEIAGLGRDLPIPVALAEVDLPFLTTTYEFAREGGIGVAGGGGRFRGRDGLDMGLALKSLGESESWGGESAEGAAAAPSAAAPAPVMSPAAPPGEPLLEEGKKLMSREEAGDDVLDADEIADEEAEADDKFAAKDARVAMERLRRSASRLKSGFVADAESQGGAERGLDGSFASPWPRPPGPLSAGDLGFPWVGVPPEEPPAFDEPAWDPVALEALRALKRTPASFQGALRMVVDSGTLHPLRDRVLRRARSEQILSARRWHSRNESPDQETTESWLSETERGVLNAFRRLGRRRAAVDADRGVWTAILTGADMLRQYAAQFRRPPTVTKEGDLVHLVFRGDADPENETHVTIDPARGVVVEMHGVLQGRTTWATRHTDFVEAAGLWWPTKTETLDPEGHVVFRRTARVEALDPAAFDAAFAATLAPHADAVFLGLEEPRLQDAKQAVHDGRAELPHHLVVLLDQASRQRWEPMWKAWGAAEALLSGKPGLPWMRLELEVRSRRGTEALPRITALAAEVLKAATPAAAWLAQWLDNRASQILGARERLTLVQQLLPTWSKTSEEPEAQPGGAREFWSLYARHMLAHASQVAGFPAEARKIRAELAAERPWDVQAVLARARDLEATADTMGAAAYLDERITQGGPWTREEEQQLYQTWFEYLWQLRDLPGLRVGVDRWLATKPETPWPYQVHASVLYFQGKYEDADRWVLENLSREVPALADRAAAAATDAAVEIALGQGWNFWAQVVVPAWRQPLADLALRTARGESPKRDRASRILSDWRYHQTEERRLALDALRQDILAEGAVAAMPYPRLRDYVAWLGQERFPGDVASWRKPVVDALLARWRATTDPVDADLLATLADGLLQQHADKDGQEARIAFLREWLSKAEARFLAARAQVLFDALLDAPHDAAREDEAFALIPRLLDAKAPPHAQSGRAGQAARRLAAYVYEARNAAALGEPETRAAWTRAESVLKTREARQKARAATADRFGTAAATAAAPVRSWLEVERLGYFVETQADLSRAEAEARELLDTVVGASVVRERPSRQDEDEVDRVLAERTALVLAYAATRRGTPEGLADRVLELFQGKLAADAGILAWRYQVFRLLVALDRVPDLEQALASWTRQDEVENRWRVALAYLFAETRRLREAADTLEGAAALDDLGGAEWGALATWYLVLKEDARRDAALDRRYEAMAEWQIQNLVWQQVNKVQRAGGGIPDDLDPEALRMLRVLLRKAEQPGQYVGMAVNLYQPTKDFRVLESLADGVLGHTPEGVYGFVKNATQVIQQIHEEATCDTLVERLGALLAKAIRPVDRRGLQLLVAAVESRAALVTKKDPGHGARALAALRAAFEEGPFVPGERRLMAAHLAQMGTPDDPAIASEQLKHLADLLAAADEGPMERLQIGTSLATVLWQRSRREDAVDRLGNLLAEVRTASGGTLPQEADGSYQLLLRWWAELGRFKQVETRLKEDIAAEVSSGRREQFRMQLFQLYVNTLNGKGALSLGSGADLLKAAAAEMERYLFEGPAYLFQQAAQTHGNLHVTAQKQAGVKDAGVLYEQFVRQRLPEALTRAPLETLDVLGTACGVLEQIRGPLVALEIMLARVETEPSWFERIGLDAWSRYNGSMAHWRHRAGRVGALEPRLLALLLKKLEESLVAMSGEGNAFWHRNYDSFWAEHRGDFAAVAGRVAELHASSVNVVLHVARYQRQGLALVREAVGTLLAAAARPNAPEAIRNQLARWLAEDKRYAEALPFVEALVAERQESLPYRTLLADVLHGLGRDAEALQALETAAARWKEKKIWNMGVAATLAQSALNVGAPKQAAAWIEDALRMRREAGGGAGPDRQLSTWYQLLARARSLLSETDAAVKAAAAAIVAWGRDMENRAKALDALRQVIADAKDRDRWLASYDAEVAASGLDAPTIRKAVGQVFLKNGSFRRAADQLLIARDLDAADAETHKLLVQALDSLGDAKAAVDALFASVRTAPRNLEAYEDLARRYQQAGDAQNAERARTNLVEAMPSEAEGWRALARIREANARWALAVEHWRQVVRIRSLEPDGWLALARAQIEAGDKPGARASLDHVMKGTWDERFGDVKAEAAKLLPRTQ